MDRCTACGKCVEACPRNLFKIVSLSQKVFVRCANTQKGALIAKKCAVGCIACRKCVKTCPFEAIQVVDNLAVIDPDKCTNCALCAKACPKKSIEDTVPPECRKVAYIQDTCTGTGKCQEKCPVKAIDGSDDERRVVNPNCVGCEACAKVCQSMLGLTVSISLNIVKIMQDRHWIGGKNTCLRIF